MKPRDAASGVHLLREHVPAEGDAPFQGDRRKIGAMSAFRFRPALHRRKKPSNRGAKEIQKAEIGADCLDAIAVLRAFRTKLQKLHDALEIITGSEPLDARNVLYFSREDLLRGYRNKRAAIRHEELQQQHNRASENDSGHHRGTTASREGTVRASSGTCQNVYAQDNGRKQPNNGVRDSKKDPRL